MIEKKYRKDINCNNCRKCGENTCGNDTENLSCFEPRLMLRTEKEKVILIIKRHLKGIEKAVEKLETEEKMPISLKSYKKKVNEIIKNSFRLGLECNNNCTNKFMGFYCEHKDNCPNGRVNFALQELQEKLGKE